MVGHRDDAGCLGGAAGESDEMNEQQKRYEAEAGRQPVSGAQPLAQGEEDAAEQHQLQALLDDYRESLQDQRDGFAALVDKLGSVPSPTARMGRLSALHGLRTAEARLGWIEEAAAALSDDDEH